MPIKFSDEDAIIDFKVPETSPPDELPSVAVPYDAETLAWEALVLASGGTLAADSKDIADALIVAIKASTFNSKIRYLLPFLGGNLAAARVPLRDSFGVGTANSFNFVEADFSQATGLQSNGSTKRLGTTIAIGTLQTGTNFGGFGFWERNAVAGNHYLMGARGTSLWMLYKDTGTPRAGGYFATGNIFDTASHGNDHFYLQSESISSLAIFKNGAVSASTTSNNGPVVGAPEINIFAVDGSFFATSRGGVAYLTDGTLTTGEIAAFHSLLQTYLITATGR